MFYKSPWCQNGESGVGKESFGHKEFQVQWVYQALRKLRIGIKSCGKTKVASQDWMHYNTTTLQGETSQRTTSSWVNLPLRFHSFVDKIVYSQAQSGTAQGRAVLCKSLVHQFMNYVSSEKIPFISLEVIPWKFPHYIIFSGSYISTTKFKFCQYCSY